MSSDSLTWLLTKKNSSFIVKRKGTEFATEPFNLMNINSRKYSGFANEKAIDISLKDKKVQLSSKIAKFQRKPAKSVNVTPLNKGYRGVVNTLKSQTKKNFYRADLQRAALARWTALNKVSKVEQGILKKKTIRRKRNQRA